MHTNFSKDVLSVVLVVVVCKMIFDIEIKYTGGVVDKEMTPESWTLEVLKSMEAGLFFCCFF